MTEQTPRDRLADAVKALEDVTPGPFTDDDIRKRLGAWSAEVIIAARALLAAPDEPSLEFTGSPSLWHGDNFTHIRIDRVLADAELARVRRAIDPTAPDEGAELRALRALGRAGYWTGFADDGTVHGGGETAPTAVELAAKLGIEVSRE